METYNGHVRTPTDAIILFEACRLGLLPRVQRRLSEKERQLIRSGSVFVWDEREAGMRRWTDGKSWSASRVSGSFLTYREMEGKRGANSVAPLSAGSGRTPDSATTNGEDSSQTPQVEAEEGPDGYRYKPDGLMKQSFSITTSQGQHLHLISYFARSHPTAPGLRQPSNDPNLSQIQPAKNMYPETTVNDHANVPAVTQSPMAGAPGYAMAPPSPYTRPGATHPQAYMMPGYPPYMGYPPGPPPPGYPHMHPYAYAPIQGSLPPPGYPGPPHAYSHPPPMSQPPPAFDQRPIHSSDGKPPLQSPLQPPAATRPPNGGVPYPTGQAPLPSYNSPTLPRPPSAIKSESPVQASGPPVQIDPRLTGNREEPLEVHASRQSQEAMSPEQRTIQNGSTAVTASQAPSIGALVNGSISSTTPTANKENTADGGAGEGSGEKATKKTTQPQMQDIPSEKLGFHEDSRALRQLDKVFAA